MDTPSEKTNVLTFVPSKKNKSKSRLEVPSVLTQMSEQHKSFPPNFNFINFANHPALWCAISTKVLAINDDGNDYTPPPPMRAA